MSAQHADVYVPNCSTALIPVPGTSDRAGKTLYGDGGGHGVGGGSVLGSHAHLGVVLGAGRSCVRYTPYWWSVRRRIPTVLSWRMGGDCAGGRGRWAARADSDRMRSAGQDPHARSRAVLERVGALPPRALDTVVHHTATNVRRYRRFLQGFVCTKLSGNVRSGRGNDSRRRTTTLLTSCRRDVGGRFTSPQQ